ncbi:MAG: N-acetylated-alpha-linked acidic dipeptidase [Rhodothermales bacterium]|jgi:N-acetylated-alpha-linked acidic dipeptidase
MRLIITLLVIVFAAFGAVPDSSLIGFTAERAAAQLAMEQAFDGHVQPQNLDTWMRHLTSRPQHVGSPAALENAEWTAAKFREWGYDTEIVRYDVLFPTPLERHLEMVAPSRFVASLDEPELAEDPSSSIRKDMLPPYTAYSADGDVTGELVYVNYGIPSDYEELAKRGISVEGRVVIARYGGSWRGIKPKVAFEHGAIGCILYSDPRDDGYFQGDVYPEGSFRMENGAQRGSVADMPTYPGDPLTPFVGATPDAVRLTVAEAPTIMKIPVLPISYADALPLLKAIDGPVAPAAWRGALPLTYHMGPGPARVNLKLRFSWDIVPAYNVIARMEGSELPDEWVMRGNHRDAWVFGAADPTSGHVALMEEARVIGELAREGHRPRRTILFGSWDAEEPGLLGSTEWVEDHAVELRQKLVAYINTDGSGRGFLGMGGSHALEPLINQVARSVTDPQTGVSVSDRLRARRRAGGEREADTRADLRISPLGSGSDYTPFLQHLGIASLNLGFGGENSGGSYHSAYDSYEYYVRFGDPGFVYGATLAKVAGRVTLRLANADVLPFRYTAFADNVSGYVDEVVELADTRRTEATRERSLIADGVYGLAADPTKTFITPPPPDAVPHLNFAPLLNARESLVAAAAELQKALEGADGSEQLNAALFQAERVMTRDDGLPKRPWFRHQIYAPGYYTGYGVKTLPGVREAIEEADWDLVAQQITRVSGTLEAVASHLRSAAAIATRP